MRCGCAQETCGACTAACAKCGEKGQVVDTVAAPVKAAVALSTAQRLGDARARAVTPATTSYGVKTIDFCPKPHVS